MRLISEVRCKTFIVNSVLHKSLAMYNSSCLFKGKVLQIHSKTRPESYNSDWSYSQKGEYAISWLDLPITLHKADSAVRLDVLLAAVLRYSGAGYGLRIYRCDSSNQCTRIHLDKQTHNLYVNKDNYHQSSPYGLIDRPGRF